MDFIAEIGTAHAGSLSRAKELVVAAKESGADTVKFQWVIADEIVSKKTGTSHFAYADFDLYRSFKHCEQDIDFYAELCEYAKQLNIRFLCSVFGPTSLSHYLQLNPDRIKIASPEINHYPLLRGLRDHLETTKTQVMLSTGLASLLDIYRFIETVGSMENLALLHCVTEYPAHCTHYMPAILPSYRELFHAQTGISDHSNSASLLPALAVCYGSSITEKHFTIDKNGPGLDDPIALNPQEFASMVRDTKKMLSLMEESPEQRMSFLHELAGDIDIRSVLSAEHWESPPLRNIYESSRRSIFTAGNFSSNTPLKAAPLKTLRSEKNLQPGIPAEFLAYAQDLTISTPLKADTALQFHALRQEHCPGNTN